MFSYCSLRRPNRVGVFDYCFIQAFTITVMTFIEILGASVINVAVDAADISKLVVEVWIRAIMNGVEYPVFTMSTMD